MRSARALFLLLSIGCLPVSTFAGVIHFDDLANGRVPVGYRGLTWGVSADDAVPGRMGFFSALDNSTYATPRSGAKYVVNTFGPDDLWFSFASPVSFTGAWFAHAGSAEANRAAKVRVRDDLGNRSAWLTLTDAPQFLDAGFLGSTTIYVERNGGAGGRPGVGNARWYTMDDVTYEPSGLAIPEPTTTLLLACGLLALSVRRRRAP